MKQYLAMAATAVRATPPKEVVVDAGITVLLLLLPGTAKKHKKRKPWDCNFYKKKEEQNDGTIFIGTRRHDYNNDNHNYNDDGGGYGNYHTVSEDDDYNGNNNINGCSLLDGWCTRFSARIWGNKDGEDALSETGCRKDMRGSGLKDQANLLCAVVDHTTMAAARVLAGFDSSKEQVTAKY
jgi:hypothetical protein